MSTKEDRSVKVKVKVIVEPPSQANVAEFNCEFQDTYLDREMSKVDAAKELAEIQQSFTEFMERYHTDPKRTHPDLTDCELRSLASDHGRVQSSAAPFGVSTYNDSELIKSFTTILWPSCRLPQEKRLSIRISLNILTLKSREPHKESKAA